MKNEILKKLHSIAKVATENDMRMVGSCYIEVMGSIAEFDRAIEAIKDFPRRGTHFSVTPTFTVSVLLG